MMDVFFRDFACYVLHSYLTVMNAMSLVSIRQYCHVLCCLVSSRFATTACFILQARDLLLAEDVPKGAVFKLSITYKV